MGRLSGPGAEPRAATPYASTAPVSVASHIDVVMDDGAAVAAPAGVAWNPHRAREAKATSPAKVAPTESFQRHFVMVGLHPSRRESDGSSAKTATHLR